MNRSERQMSLRTHESRKKVKCPTADNNTRFNQRKRGLDKIMRKGCQKWVEPHL